MFSLQADEFKKYEFKKILDFCKLNSISQKWIPQYSI